MAERYRLPQGRGVTPRRIEPSRPDRLDDASDPDSGMMVW